MKATATSNTLNTKIGKIAKATRQQRQQPNITFIVPTPRSDQMVWPWKLQSSHLDSSNIFQKVLSHSPVSCQDVCMSDRKSRWMESVYWVNVWSFPTKWHFLCDGTIISPGLKNRQFPWAPYSRRLLWDHMCCATIPLLKSASICDARIRLSCLSGLSCLSCLPLPTNLPT